MADNQDQNQNGPGLWKDIGVGAGIEAASTFAEQTVATLGGAGIAYGVSKIGGHFSPGLGTKAGVLQHGFMGGFKAGHGSLKRIAMNYGFNVGTAAIGGGIGLHLLHSNEAHNKINSNEAINDHPMLMSSIGGAMAATAFVGLPMAGAMSMGPKELAHIAGSEGITNFLNKRKQEINDSKLPDDRKTEEKARIDRYLDMQKKITSLPEEDVAGRKAAALDVAKDVRKGLLGETINNALEKSTDKVMSKLYHMKGRSAAIVGASALLGGIGGAIYHKSHSDGNDPPMDPTWSGAGIGAGAGAGLGLGITGVTHAKSQAFRGMSGKSKAAAYAGSALSGSIPGLLLGGVSGAHYADTNGGN